MSFCKKCGYQLTEDSKFCPKCGETIENDGNTKKANPTKGGKRVHCPKCGDTTLTPATESTTTGGNVRRNLGGQSATITMNTVHRNYWLCHACGHKFRNIENLEEEIAVTEKKSKSFITCGIIFVIAAILIFIINIPVLSMFAGLVMIIAGIAMAVSGLMAKSSINAMKQELAYLKENCF